MEELDGDENWNISVTGVFLLAADKEEDDLVEVDIAPLFPILEGDDLVGSL